MSKKLVYLDHAATTPVHPKVLEKMLPYYKEDFGNPSSTHSFGRKVKVAIEEARETIAEHINADAREIYFVSGGTEANNFPIFGIARTVLNESGKNTLLSTSTEHHCILETLTELGKNGFNINLLNVKNDGTLDLSLLDKTITENTALVSSIHINNETGIENDINEIAKISHRNKSFFHSDAVQSFGKIPIDVKKLDVDSLSFSSHKINGPKGAGAVYVKNGTPLSPIIFGGSQERNRRGGTENPAAIIGFAEAVKIAKEEALDNFVIVKGLRDYFVNGLNQIDQLGIEINGQTNSYPYILSVTFKNKFYNNDIEAMLMYLDINGIAVSNGAACSSGALKPSHVILAMGKPLNDASGTIRISFSAKNTIDEITYALEIINKMSKKFRK